MDRNIKKFKKKKDLAKSKREEKEFLEWLNFIKNQESSDQ